jgi:hypothetical protein
MKPLLALLSLAAIIGTAAPAYADASDDQFLAALTASGVTYQDPGKVIAAAKWVCQSLNQGTQMVDVVRTVQSENAGLHQENAAKFTALAASAYCPNKLPPPAAAPAPAAATPANNG